MRNRVYVRGVLFLIALVLLASCAREAPEQPAAPTPPASQPAAQPTEPAAAAPPAAAPATPTPAAKPAGPAATENHRLRVANYAQAAVTVSVNGVWIGQWDTHVTVPLESVIQGKNQLTVELGSQPNNELRIELEAERGEQWVNLLRLNFQGKTGTHNFTFVAR